MAKIIPIDEHFQPFLAELKESFWGDLYGQTRQAWQRFFEQESQRLRDRFSGWAPYERRRGKRPRYRNGYYERDFVTRFGTIRLRIARTREKSFLPVGLRRFQRRAEEVSLLIREAFLRGISTRQVGRVVATITGETVSAQTVSKLTRDLDEAVRQFHQARLSDDYLYLFLDGVSLRVRRPTGRKQVQMLVAYGIRQDGSRHLLAFLRSQGEGQADWEALLQDLYRRGLEGRALQLILTDGCVGFGGGDSHGVSAGAASALLGAQDAQPPGEGAEMRLRRNESRSPGHLPRRRPSPGRGRVPSLPRSLAWPLSGHGQAVRARLARVAVVLRFPSTSVEEVAHHQHHRALLCGSPAANQTHGVFRERGKRGPHHLLHLPEIQPGMEIPHPQPIYTSSLTLPTLRRGLHCLRAESILSGTS
jgi:putative transposase